MLLASGPYYTYHFGSLGCALETARQSAFFQWFHLVETERHPEQPGEVARFRPSGEKFRNLCYLDILMGPAGEAVRMELVVWRSFIEGPDRHFARDLVKSFLRDALPDACRDVLQDFIKDIGFQGGDGGTPGYGVYRGVQPAWREETGWSRLLLTNLPLAVAP